MLDRNDCKSNLNKCFWSAKTFLTNWNRNKRLSLLFYHLLHIQIKIVYFPLVMNILSTIIAKRYNCSKFFENHPFQQNSSEVFFLVFLFFFIVQARWIIWHSRPINIKSILAAVFCIKLEMGLNFHSECDDLIVPSQMMFRRLIIFSGFA